MKKEFYSKIKSETDKTRQKALFEAESRLEKVRRTVPGYSELEHEIAKLSISAAKAGIASPNDSDKISAELKKRIQEINDSQIDLIRKAGFPENYMRPIFSCVQCEDTGIIYDQQGDRLCSCFRQHVLDCIYEESGLVKAGTAKFSNFNLSIFSDEIDEKRFLIKKSPKEQIQKIKGFCLEYIKTGFMELGGKGLLFFGTTGSGKTFMTQCVANELISAGRSVVYVSAPLMFDKLNEARMTFGEEAHEDYFAGLRDAELLVIDDLGTETMTEAKSSNLWQILNTRSKLDLVSPHKTIISTNLNLNGIKERYDDRIYSRIIGLSFILQFGGEDLRIITK